MSEILKDGMPCVEDKNNQLTSEGLPEDSYVLKQLQEDMDKMM